MVEHEERFQGQWYAADIVPSCDSMIEFNVLQSRQKLILVALLPSGATPETPKLRAQLLLKGLRNFTMQSCNSESIKGLAI